MPTVFGTDVFSHNNFTVPGGGPYSGITGTPQFDISVVNPGDPGSLLLDSTAGCSVSYDVSGATPLRMWNGVFCRINTGDWPAATAALINQMFPLAGNGGKWGYSTIANQFFTELGAGQQLAAFSLNTWHWVETILDASSGTRAMYIRIDGVDITPTTNVEAGSTGNSFFLGATFGTFRARFSRAMRGSAASITDWLGQPGGESLTYDPPIRILGYGAG